MDEATGRAAIVAEARSWVRTPYMHRQGVKGAGVDCAQLLVRVYCDLGLGPKFDTGNYPTDWFRHRDGERYLAFVDERARRVDQPKPGDVFVVKLGRAYAHGGFVTETSPLRIVHAFSMYRMVVEELAMNNFQISGRLSTAVYASFW